MINDDHADREKTPTGADPVVRHESLDFFSDGAASAANAVHLNVSSGPGSGEPKTEPNATNSAANAGSDTGRKTGEQVFPVDPALYSLGSGTASGEPQKKGEQVFPVDPALYSLAKADQPPSKPRRRLLSNIGSAIANRGFHRCLFLALLLVSALAAFWQPPLALVGLGIYALSGMWLASHHMKHPLLVGGFFGALTYAALLVVLTLVLPALHVVTQGAWQLLPLVAAVLVIGLSLGVLRQCQRRGFRLAGVAGIGLGALLVPFFAFTNSANWVIEWQMRESIDPIELTELPETVNDRLVPRRTAQEFIQNANRDNRLTVPEPHLVLTEDNLFWQRGLNYTVWYGKLLGSTNGVIRIDADRTEMDADTKTGSNASFLFGEQSWVVHTAFALRHPFSKEAEHLYWKKPDGSWVLLVSYTSTRPTATGTMIPYLAGVLEVTPNGWISDHSVRDAARLFPGAPFYPPTLARQYGEAYAKWRGGLFSQAVSRANILEISEAASGDPTVNRFPFLQHFKGLGLQEVIPFEPQGASSYALVEVLLFDAGTGQTRLYRTPATAVLNAARKAIENVRKADPNADWSHRREVEPRLVITPKGMYWLISIVQNSPDNPTNYAYIMSIIVNAKDLNAQRIDNSVQLERFLAGQPVGH